MKQKRTLAVFIALSCLVAAFIFCQSLQTAEASNEQSGRLMSLLRALLDPQGRIEEHTFHIAVRKAAHFTEFAVLGLCVGASALTVCHMKRQRYVSLPVLVTLLVALADECIQYFTGRSSQVYDVLLDLAGALTGLGLAMLIAHLGSRRKRNPHETGI